MNKNSFLKQVKQLIFYLKICDFEVGFFMATSQLMKKCVECNKTTMHYQEKPNHILHLLISIVTAGIWLIVWLLFINAKDPQCSVCGRANNFFGNITHQQKDIMKEIKLKNSLNNGPSNTWLFIFGLIVCSLVVTYFKIQ